jgi:hypothetical protein
LTGPLDATTIGLLYSVAYSLTLAKVEHKPAAEVGLWMGLFAFDQHNGNLRKGILWL